MITGYDLPYDRKLKAVIKGTDWKYKPKNKN